MSNILKYQNPSSPLLNAGYKKHDRDDLSDIETFNKNWLNYRNSQLANQGWKDESIKNKLNWFQRNFGASDKTVANLVREQLFSNLDNTKELSFSDALKDSQGRYLLTESMYADFPGERKLHEVEIGPPKPVEDWKLDYSFNGSVKGTQYPDFNTIIYNDLYQNTPIKIHERDHAMFGQYHDKNIGLKIVDNIFKHEFLDDNVSDKWGYYDDPGEIRARLMEMRFDNKLDPIHIYTKEEIKSMRNDPNFKDHHIFDRYSDKYIEYLLNTVAQNTTDPNHIDYRDPITFAKKGGRIHIKKKNRGKFTEYCGGKVTQECIAKGKKSKDPKIRKRATFAANARKWKHENGGILKYQNPAEPLLESKDTLNTSYLTFKRTLPDNLRLTPEKDYHMYDYWKLNGEPKNFREGKRRGMFTWDNSDKGYHAGSIAEDRNTGIYHFMKPKHHPTVKYELDWFTKGLKTLEGGEQVPVEGKDKKFWEDFTSKYQLDSTGVDYRYIPIQKNGGILKALDYANYITKKPT